MKNLKIGQKIMLGFSIAIVLLLVISAVTIYSNLSANSNVTKVQSDSDYQTLASELTTIFWNANSAAQEVYLSHTEDAYNNYLTYMASADTKITEMKSSIAADANLKKFENGLLNAETSFNEFKEHISAVNSSNQTLNAAIMNANVQTANLTAAADSAYQNQQEILRTESENDELSYADKIRRADRLDSTMVFFKDILAMIDIGDTMVLSFDTESYDKFITECDRIIDAHQEYIDSAKNQGTKDAAQVAIDCLKPYKETIISFNTSNVDNIKKTAEAKEHVVELSLILDDYFDEVHDSMVSRISSTKTSSISSLTISIIISVIAVVSALIAASLIINAITKPINRMKDNLVDMGTTGNITLSAEQMEIAAQDAMSKDEVGECVSAYLNLVKYLNNIGNQVNIVAGGDITVDVVPMSENDIIGNSFAHLVDRLNEIFHGFRESTNQIAMNSNHIADGSQSLAQGSTEQAASIDRLFDSISDVAETTNINTEKANTAASLAGNIKIKAEAGSVSMKNMVDAVNEINEASNAISRVIKVIDDIAFQTNILALNAAVEAARAGSAGKGFAVVADEVRNLAAKSADAAKSTSALIESSMQKAEMGSKIAVETSASFEEIVEGIKQSTIVISEIAELSEQQRTAVAEINQSIEQVSQVVQQNSANAEQSAAAAEELHGQSSNLDELVAEYKLK